MILSPRPRLYLAAGLFVGWLGFLLFLVLQSRDQVILSRPQFLVANLHVVARLTGPAEHPDAKACIQQVLWSADEADGKLQGAEVEVLNLIATGPEQGWQGPGDYLLPLLKTKEGSRLAPIPLSPSLNRSERLRIYPATPQALRQRDSLQP